MIRWLMLVVAIVGVSAAIPVVLSLQPEPAKGRGVKHAVPDALRTGPVGKVFVDGETVHDFGQMAQFANGSREYVVKNVGDGPLEMRPGSSTCGCTVANFADGKKSLALEPGESTTITITWETRDNSGKFEKMLSVWTSDPFRQDVWFTVRGTVHPAIVTVPQDLALNFGAIENSDTVTARVAMSSLDRPDFKILKMTSTRPDLVVPTSRELTSQEMADLKFKSGHRVDVEMRPSAEIGTFAEEVVVITDHPNRQELRIPLRGKRVGAISAAPERLRLEANSSSGTRQSVMLLVRNQESTHFEVAEKPERVAVTIEPAASRADNEKVKRYKLTIVVPAGLEPGEIKGDVVLKTDHPSVGRFHLPVSGVIIGGS
jgi:hypothetical protein